ncbi:hypothetical protein GW932_01740 [archaeon]|nr:hypothetical protein [archaeon]
MNECYRCGATERESVLYEAVNTTGVVFVCRKCYFKYRMPLIEKKHVEWKDVEKRESVRERLAKIAHVDLNATKTRVVPKSQTDMTLREIVEKNFQKTKIEKTNLPSELIDNFNWVIMRKRRMLKLTQEELAMKLQEPEVVIHEIERGNLPRDYKVLIKKLEAYLGVYLFKERDNEISSEDITNEAKTPTGILTSEIKEKTGIRGWFFSKKKEETSEEELELEDLNLESINEIVGEPVEDVKIEPVIEEPKVRYNFKREEPKELFFEQKSFSDKDFYKPREDKNIFSHAEETKKEVIEEKEELSSEDINDLIWKRRE